MTRLIPVFIALALAACDGAPPAPPLGLLHLRVDADFCADGQYGSWDRLCGDGVGDAVWDVRVSHFEPYEEDDVRTFRLRRGAAPNPDASAGVALDLPCRPASDRGGNRVTVRLVGLYAAPLEEVGEWGEAAPEGAIELDDEPADHFVVFTCPAATPVTLHVNEQLHEPLPFPWSWDPGDLELATYADYPGWPGCHDCVTTAVWDLAVLGDADDYGIDHARLDLDRVPYDNTMTACRMTLGDEVVDLVEATLVGVYRGQLPWDADVGPAAGPAPEGALPVVAPAVLSLPVDCSAGHDNVSSRAVLMTPPEPGVDGAPAALRFGHFSCTARATACAGEVTLGWTCGHRDPEVDWRLSFDAVTVRCGDDAEARVAPTTGEVLDDPAGLIASADVAPGVWRLELRLAEDAPSGCVVTSAATAMELPAWTGYDATAYPRVDWRVPIPSAADAQCRTSDLLTDDGAITADYDYPARGEDVELPYPPRQ